jgi:hypothetical protein
MPTKEHINQNDDAGLAFMGSGPEWPPTEAGAFLRHVETRGRKVLAVQRLHPKRTNWNAD